MGIRFERAESRLAKGDRAGQPVLLAWRPDSLRGPAETFERSWAEAFDATWSFRA